MKDLIDVLLMAVLAINLFALGVSRMRAVIRAVAAQGVIIGILPLLVEQSFELRAIFLALGTIALKGFIIPALLSYAMREVDIRREVKPLVDFVPSILLGAVGIALALVFATKLPLAPAQQNSPLIATSLLIPTSLATALTGFLILTTRQIAINQVLGYLVLENGIFIFGILLLGAMPFLVEVGVLLDLFTGVFVMGIIINHISREFASVSTEHLSELKEE
jgi:hydrogenase-4 component E